jgi:hypothetical protein
MADGPWNDFKQSQQAAPKQSGPWDDFSTTPQVATAGGDASGEMGAPGTPGAHARPTPIDVGGMAREGTAGLLSGFSGLPESQHPLQDMAKGNIQGSLGYQIGQHISGDPNAPGYLEMMKQHSPFTGAVDTAKGLYGAGKEIATSPDQAGIAHGLGSFTGQLLQLSAMMKGGNKVATPEVSAAARLVEKGASINQGQVTVSKGMVKAPIAMLDAKVQAEIARHVDTVLQADELHNKITNNPVGYVNAVEAASDASKASEKIGGEFAPKVGKLIQRANQGPMTLREAKALTTQVGDAMQGASAREKAVLTSLYDSLHDATASRADDLGSAYGKSWQQYIDVTRSHYTMKSGLLGDLQREPVHAKVLDKLVNPDNAVEVKEIAAKMKKFGVDPKPFLEAREVGQNLNMVSQETKNAFIGKIRAIMKYPYAAGPGAAAASYLGSSMLHIPGAGLVLPLIVASKIGGFLDAAALRSILADIKKRVPAEMPMGEGQPPINTRQIYDPGPGPMPTPAPPVAGESQMEMDRRLGTSSVRQDPRETLSNVGAQLSAEDEAKRTAWATQQKGATPGQAADMTDAQIAEEERQLMARKLQRTRKQKGKKP